jgi:hypothetical protein
MHERNALTRCAMRDRDSKACVCEYACGVWRFSYVCNGHAL